MVLYRHTSPSGWVGQPTDVWFVVDSSMATNQLLSHFWDEVKLVCADPCYAGKVLIGANIEESRRFQDT